MTRRRSTRVLLDQTSLEALKALQRLYATDVEWDGYISDAPEEFFAKWLRDIAQEIEDGWYVPQGLTQGSPSDSTFEFTVLLKHAIPTLRDIGGGSHALDVPDESHLL